MVKAAVREGCIQVGWVDTVNELCEKLSVLPRNYEPSTSSSYCRELLSHLRYVKPELKMELYYICILVAVCWK